MNVRTILNERAGSVNALDACPTRSRGSPSLCEGLCQDSTNGRSRQERFPQGFFRVEGIGDFQNQLFGTAAMFACPRMILLVRA